MKFIFILLLFSTVCVFKLSAQKSNAIVISDVQIKNSWIIVYNENGKEISRMSQAKKEVFGITGGFFVVTTSNGWIITYNEKCKEIARMVSSNKQVKGAAGETFTVISNGWIITYDKKCKEKNRRPK